MNLLITNLTIIYVRHILPKKVMTMILMVIFVILLLRYEIDNRLYDIVWPEFTRQLAQENILF
jgi:hypothetical protein